MCGNARSTTNEVKRKRDGKEDGIMHKGIQVLWEKDEREDNAKVYTTITSGYCNVVPRCTFPLAPHCVEKVHVSSH